MTKNFDEKLLKYFNEFFIDAVPNLSMPEFTGNLDQPGTVLSACPIISVVAKYENHPSITKIKNRQASFVTFSFSLVEKKEIEKILWNLSKKKACQKSDIPLRIVKEKIHISK